MNFADVLSGHAKLEGIQWMLRTGAPRRALRRELSALLPAPEMLGHCRLRYARFGPGHKLTAYYDAHTCVAGGYRVRPIAATWSLDGGAEQLHGPVELAELQAEAVRRGVSAPFQQLVADVPAWGMHIRVSPLDARFPQLIRLSDPRYVREMLAAAYAAGGLASDQPRPDGYAVTSIHYAPGGRHVLRYDPLDSAKGGTVFAKLYTGEEGARIFRMVKQVADWLEEHGEGVTAVRPLGYVAEDGVVLYPRVPGAPLSERLRRRYRGVEQCLECAGAALHALHHLPQEVAGPLQPHDFAAEIGKIARASNHIPALLPSVGEAINALFDRARELHERLPQEPPTFTHLDFKSKHVWGTPGRLTFIDVDNCRLADPALDVGKFLADLRLRYITYDRPGLEQAQERFLAGYTPAAPEERLVRARLYEAVEMVRMTVGRVWLFDRNWGARTERLIRRAGTLMNDLQLVLGLPATQPSLRGSQKHHHPRFGWRRPPSNKGAQC